MTLPEIIIAEAFERHDRAIVQFSGGKDSLSVLHMCRPWKDRVTVHYGDTGDAYPHVLQFVADTCDSWGFKLEIVRPDVSVHDYVETAGLPTDVLPSWTHPSAARFLPPDRKPEVLMQTGLECCAAMLYTPVHNALLASGCTLVIRGSKGTDEHITAPNGLVYDNIEFLSPLWNWTDEFVFRYLAENNVELPMQYLHGCKHSLDCAECTAWGDTAAERQRMEFTRTFYPERFKAWRLKMDRIRSEIQTQLDRVEPYINFGLED